MRAKKPKRPCSTCGWHDAVIRGECRTCIMWRRNHYGEQRPVAAIVAHGERMLEKRLSA